MPVGGIGRILRMIEDADDYIFALYVARKSHPLGASSPGALLANLALAAQIDPVDSLVVHHRNFGRVAVGIRKDLGLVGGLLELAGYANAERALLAVVEDHLLVLGCERDDAVDDPDILRCPEDDPLVFLHDLLAARHDPVHGDVHLSAVLAVGHLVHGAMLDGAHLLGALAAAVIPEVNS